MIQLTETQLRGLVDLCGGMQSYAGGRYARYVAQLMADPFRQPPVIWLWRGFIFIRPGKRQ